MCNVFLKILSEYNTKPAFYKPFYLKGFSPLITRTNIDITATIRRM
jgi:hypothetical protein